ncbi:hypothetical protein HA402_011049 [Bradysia odoriphaga]|nr:hypothetical protein HA402_011049 [Bradysia odoriphaga]
MEIGKPFYDLCVPYTKDHDELYRILQELYEYGYRTVAIDQPFDHIKEAKKSSDIFPAPVPLDEFKEQFKNKLKILNRITITYSDSVINHAMNNSQNLKKYNIIAGIPKTDQAMQHCCSTFLGDIVGMNLDDGARSVIVNHKYYQLAVRRGMCFEVRYSPMIIDSNQRKEILTIGHTYASQRKSKNIIICSGATNKFHVRSPYDIANLGLIFGLSEEQSKAAISHICRSLLLRAEARRYGKTVMTVKIANKSAKSDTDDDDDDDSDDDTDDGMQMDVSEERDVVAVSDDSSSVELVTQPSKKKKLN